ncbi:hypothetical protein ACFSKU_04975 [Pontibacter silvestris]|uniref:Viral A-type inclusion protein n=1 Tax=Pontibacter silvestris TaxID=2305183 RepID=A0ABW4WVK6_9BACT|nr:hypothetical protein [Pontibacter silvestris]MCC9136889.1 hypothetical protein [Pontibacter silvestris]
MKYLLYFFLSFALLIRCNSGPSEQEQKQEFENEVMRVHNESMAKMGTIYRLRLNLRKLRDTLETQTTDTSVTNLLSQQIKGLNQADEAMMGWMHQYKAPDTLQHQLAMQYLQEQLNLINQVKLKMDSTIDVAQTTYRQYEQN